MTSILVYLKTVNLKMCLVEIIICVWYSTTIDIGAIPARYDGKGHSLKHMLIIQ